MSVRDYTKDLLEQKRIKTKKHLELSCSNLDEDELVRKLSYLFKELADCEISNVSLCFSCDYWESDLFNEEYI